MGCYHPLIRCEDWSKPLLTAKDGHKYHQPIVFNPRDKNNQLEWFDKVKDPNYKNYVQIGCGNCIGCRLENSRQWANRGYLEAKLWEQNWFITLTYDDEHITTNELVEDEEGFTYWNDGSWNGTLVPKELQQFNKNLRQIMKRDYDQDNIRFIACGEYGSEQNSARPHYHLIIFNLNLPPEDLYNPRILGGKNGTKNVYYQSHIIERAWNKGISNISEATWNSIAYTARYITKKINGDKSVENYEQKGRSKEFFRSSNRPGIGYEYYQKYKNEIYKYDEIIIQNTNGVQKVKPPKYFDNLLKKENPDLYKKIKDKRKKDMLNNLLVKDEKTSIWRLDQLEIEEKTKLDQSYKLIREYERKAGL